jgi:glycosyltransferase involved in cell wall biosynthesis
MMDISLNSDIPLRRIIFWEPCVSPHKSDFMQAVSRTLPDVEIICCADSDVPPDRKAMGWSAPDGNGIETLIAPGAGQIERLVQGRHPGTFHVFSGTRHLSTLIRGLQAVKACGARFAILSEPRVREGWAGGLRYLQSRLTEGWLRSHCELVLAIGRNGPPWYLSVGYPSEKVFPFAYFVAPPRLSRSSSGETGGQGRPAVRVGYVGRLVAMKGVFDLVQAVARLKRPAHLTLVGGGLDEAALRKTCLEHGVDADFRGVLPIESIGEVMAQLDVLVLASTSDDGWGVVVSEALMGGTAVVATSCVGASLMLDEPSFGRLAPPRDPGAIAQAIVALAEEGAFTPSSRLQRRRLALARLSAEAGARYFVDLLHHRLAGGAPPVPFFQYPPADEIIEPCRRVGGLPTPIQG